MVDIYVFKSKIINFLYDRLNFKKLEDIPNLFFRLGRLVHYSL